VASVQALVRTGSTFLVVDIVDKVFSGVFSISSHSRCGSRLDVGRNLLQPQVVSKQNHDHRSEE
jgi:hypothetical protein